MKKSYEMEDSYSKKNHIFSDFNLYGVNLNTKEKSNTDELKSYGRTKSHDYYKIKK